MKLGLFAVVCLLFLFGCTKLAEAPIPTNAVTASSVFSADATAIGAVTAMYTSISESSLSVPGSISSLALWGGISSDELVLWSGLLNPMASAYYRNALSGQAGGYGSEYWPGLYAGIYACNSAIQGLNSSSGLTPAVKQQLMGEAVFMRALYYFYLVNLYGDAALPLTSDAGDNLLLTRIPVAAVYKQILADVSQASGLLSPNFVDATLQRPSSERVRPTKWTAFALMARVYLYTGDWPDAARMCDSVIANSSLFGLTGLNTAFLKADLGNKEAIWQLQPVNSGWNTEDAKIFAIPATGPGTGFNFGAYLSNTLLATFEPGDGRRSAWVDSAIAGGVVYYYPFKYKVASFGASVTEYLTLFRLGELYLIRAEARARSGDLTEAAADLNVIRARAGLGPSGATTQQGLVTAILHERRVELFCESGHRWFDLKRTGMIDSVMAVATPLKGGGSWKSYQQLYPVAPVDIQIDPNLTQNAGY